MLERALLKGALLERVRRDSNSPTLGLEVRRRRALCPTHLPKAKVRRPFEKSPEQAGNREKRRILTGKVRQRRRTLCGPTGS